MDVPEVPAFCTPPPPTAAVPTEVPAVVPEGAVSEPAEGPAAVRRRVTGRKANEGPSLELRRAVEALGEMLCCKIDHISEALESLERTLERTLEGAVERTLSASGGEGGTGSAQGKPVRVCRPACTGSTEPLCCSSSLVSPPLPPPLASPTVPSHEGYIEPQEFRFDSMSPLVAHPVESSLKAANCEAETGGVVREESVSPRRRSKEERRSSRRSSYNSELTSLPSMQQHGCESAMRETISQKMWPAWFQTSPEPEAPEGAEVGRDSKLKVDIRVSFQEMEQRVLDPHSSVFQHSQSFAVSGQQSLVTDEGRLQWLVLQPTSNPILFWHTIGPLLVAYDIIMIPLQAFPLPQLEAFSTIAIVNTVYWSIDVVRCFFTGYETDKGMEMRPYMIAKKYIKSWFILDFLTCTADWVFLIDGHAGVFNKFWRTGRAVQAWRLLRLVRLVRVLKFARRISTFAADQVTSVQGLIALKSVYIGFAVAISCHYMACYWYLVGDMELPPLSENSWLHEYSMANATLMDAYVSSFHWAISQSGFAPNGIYPTNTVERIYAGCVSFCWLIMVSVTINLFNIWLGQLHQANADRETQNIHLRKFLEEHDVSRKLTYRVLRCFRANYRAHRRRMHEEDIDFLRDLPVGLKITLRREVFMPVLKKHPFFNFIGIVSPTLPMMISYCAMQEDRYLAGEAVFVENTPARRMLYVHIGRLVYYAVQGSMRVTKLEAGDWACEPALWLHWTCRGRLVAESSSELVGIDVERFMAIMHYARARGEDIDTIKVFAKRLCQHFCNSCPRTDLWGDLDEMQEFADEILCSSAFR